MTKRRSFTLGSTAGVALSAALVLTDSVDVFNTPVWQKVLFFPGFWAGVGFYNCCSDWFADASMQENATLLVGVLTVGAAYGLTALGIRAVIKRLSGHHPGQNTGSKSG